MESTTQWLVYIKHAQYVRKKQCRCKLEWGRQQLQDDIQ